MRVEFRGHVDSISEDGAVRFENRPGSYRIPGRPADIGATLHRAKAAGATVRVTYDDRTFAIEDAVLD
jgi:hypothetical protein